MGADYDYVNQPPYCDTALHWAAFYANPTATEMLLKKGCVCDIANYSGVTPLQDAINHCPKSTKLIEEYFKVSVSARDRIRKYQQNLYNNPRWDVVVFCVYDSAAD